MKSLPELTEHIQNTNVIQQVAEQLHKDLNCDPDDVLYEPEDEDFIPIIQRLSNYLKEVDKLSGTQVMNILYRVDVPETLYRLHLGSSNFFEEISELILRRELQKVLFRNFHSGR